MRRAGATSWLLALLALALLYVPLMAVAVASVNAARWEAQWQGFTWGWYASLLDVGGGDPARARLAGEIRDATLRSLVLGAASTAISTVLGTALALALERAPWPRRLRAAVDAAVRLPVIVPDLLLAAALVVALEVVRRWSGTSWYGMTGMIVGHAVFQVSFVCLVVHARLRLIGAAQLEAARDLYADGWYATRRVLLPQLAPAIVAGAMLAFTLSLDDFVISFFTASPASTTLPMLIWAQVRRGVVPEIHALSTLIVLATAVLAVTVTLLARPRRSA